MNIKTALKKIVEALGGTSTAKNIPGLINEVSENVSGGGSGGDSDVFTVTFSGGNPMQVTCDRTFVEIVQAIENGKRVCGLWKQNNESGIFMSAASFSTSSAIEFNALTYHSIMQTWDFYNFKIDSSDTITFVDKSIS